MTSYVGDFRLGDTFDVKFTTVNTSGVPTTLAGSPVISAYLDNNTTELTAGITLTVDFDARTGMHNVHVVASGANGYAAGKNYQLVITTGTVGGSSVVGYVVAQFSIENRQLPPAYDFAKGTVAMTESYGADGSPPTPAQALFQLLAREYEFTISGDTLTAKKLDGVTTAMTFTLSPPGGPYTGITRTS